MEARVTRPPTATDTQYSTDAGDYDEQGHEERAQAEEEQIKARMVKVLELSAEAERCEPRVASLHQAARQLLQTSDSDSCLEVRRKLQLLSNRLQQLLGLSSRLLQHMSALLGQDYTQSFASLASEGLYGSVDTFACPTSPMSGVHRLSASTSFDSVAHSALTSSEDEGVVMRSYSFLGRVVSAALPIQALMVLMLGVASLD